MNKTCISKNDDSPSGRRRWAPCSVSLSLIMEKAKMKAMEDYEKLQGERKKSSYIRPVKNVTNRQRSSIRSAEVSRAKFRIYEKLLEEEVDRLMSEINQVQNSLTAERRSLTSITGKITTLKRRRPSLFRNCSCDQCLNESMETFYVIENNNPYKSNAEKNMPQPDIQVEDKDLGPGHTSFRKPPENCQKQSPSRNDEARTRFKSCCGEQLVSKSEEKSTGTREEMKSCSDKLKISHIIDHESSADFSIPCSETCAGSWTPTGNKLGVAASFKRGSLQNKVPESGRRSCHGRQNLGHLIEAIESITDSKEITNSTSSYISIKSSKPTSIRPIDRSAKTSITEQLIDSTTVMPEEAATDTPHHGSAEQCNDDSNGVFASCSPDGCEVHPDEDFIINISGLYCQ